jgi:hypothetical protein
MAGYVVGTGERRSSCRILVGKQEGKEPARKTKTWMGR